MVPTVYKIFFCSKPSSPLPSTLSFYHHHPLATPRTQTTMDQQFINNLTTTLEQVTSPATVQKASESLQKDFYSNPLVIPALIHILQSHPSQQIRQLAGVEARKLITREWYDSGSISDESKAQIRASLLSSTLAEQDALVRHTSSRVITAIASYDIEEGEWSELLPALHQAATSSVVAEREVSVYILYTLLEAQLEPLEPLTNNLIELFSKTLADPESLAVRVSTLEALGCIANNFETATEPEGLEQSIDAFRRLVPAMVEVLKQVITARDEKSANQVFNVFSILLNSESNLLADYFGDIMHFMIDNIISEKQLDDEFRNPALQFVLTAVRVKKLRVQALKLGPILVNAALKIAADEYRENPDDLEDDDDEDVETTPAKLALQLIDEMSNNLAPSQVMVPLLEAVPKYANSADPADRRAGYLAFAYSIEGAPDFVNTQISIVLPAVVNGLNDSDISVKVSALKALYFLSVELRDIISSEHEVLLPLVFNIMDNATALKVGKNACNALDALLESMDRKIISEKYLDSIAPKLLQLLKATTNLGLKSSIIAALSSAALASGENFTPYFNETIAALEPYASLVNSSEELSDAESTICASAISALANLAAAVGKTVFHPYAEPLIEVSYKCLSSENSRLKECSLVFVGALAKIYGTDFNVFIPKIAEQIYKLLDQEEFGGLEDYIDEEEGNVGETNEQDFMDKLQVSSGIVIEKEFATDTLGDLLEAAGVEFTDVERVLGYLVNQVNHFSEGIRRATVNTLWRMYIAWAAVYGDKDVPSVLPAPEHSHQGLAVIATQVREATFDAFTTETERVVAITILDRIAEGLKAIGPQAILSLENLEMLYEQLEMLLQKMHPAQVDEGDDGIEEIETESSEYDEVLIDSTLDVIVQLSSKIGPQAFTPVFEKLLTPMLKLASPNNQSNSERIASIGSLAEIVLGAKESITPFTDKLLTNFLHRISSDSDIEVRNNAVFGVGLICYYSQAEASVASSYPKILEKLQPFIDNASSNYRGFANAVGAVARMALKRPASVPLADVIIPTLLGGALPLTEEFEENSPVFELLYKLVESQEPTVLAARAKLTDIYAQVIVQERAGKDVFQTPEDRARVLETLKLLEAAQPGLVSGNEVLKTL